MKRISTSFRIFTFAILIHLCTINDKEIMAQDNSSNKLNGTITTSYTIEGRSVEEATFQAFTAQLEEVQGTYHCAKTKGGGRNSYEATDQNGIRWVVRSILEGKKSSVSVEKR